MKREIIHPKGFSFDKDLSEDDRWEKIEAPEIIEALKEVSAQLKVESVMRKK